MPTPPSQGHYGMAFSQALVDGAILALNRPPPVWPHRAPDEPPSDSD